MGTYVVSDLHGYKEVFDRGLEIIGFSDNDELYVIGDVIDRGPDGVDILCRIKDSKNMDLIIGNHEFMMLNSVDLNGESVCNGEDSELWLEWNGGDCTFEKYKEMSIKERQELLFWLMRRYLIKTLDRLRIIESFQGLCERNKESYDNMEYEMKRFIAWLYWTYSEEQYRFFVDNDKSGFHKRCIELYDPSTGAMKPPYNPWDYT